jgi:hypothetical protein
MRLHRNMRKHLHSELLLQQLVALQKSQAALHIRHVFGQRPSAHVCLGLGSRSFDKAVVSAIPVLPETLKKLFEREAAAQLDNASVECADKLTFQQRPWTS